MLQGIKVIMGWNRVGRSGGQRGWRVISESRLNKCFGQQCLKTHLHT